MEHETELLRIVQQVLEMGLPPANTAREVAERVWDYCHDNLGETKKMVQVLGQRVPAEVSTEEAAKLLGCSKDTVLKFRQAGLLEWRNAAPPSSSRQVFRFKLDSVLRLRTSYQVEELGLLVERERAVRIEKGRRKYKHI